MLTMAAKITRHFVQTTPQLKKLYGAWVGAMKGTKACLDRDNVTQDAIGNALWMWARDQEPEGLAEKLAPYLDQFGKAWAERDRGGKPVEDGFVNETQVLGKESRGRKQTKQG